MTPTPRTDAHIRANTGNGTQYVSADFARQLEREITELNERLIDRQKTLMTALVELQDAKRQIDKVSDGGPLTPELKQDANPPFAAPLGYASLSLMPVKRTADEMLKNMAIHYSQPRGFVGRNICYLIMAGGVCYGSIAGGSATRFLPGREVVGSLNNGVNNIFYHVEKRNGEYPTRNFTASVLKLYRETIERDWLAKYNDAVLWHETLVELPRSGECYKRDGWQLVGETKGYTCKRTAGKGTDSWSGRRVWDTVNLRPKLVFVRPITSDALTTHNRYLTA